MTPLHIAAWHQENPAVIHALLMWGADVNATNSISTTPLHLAARYQDDPALIEALLDGGADVNAEDDLSLTPLHFAARFQGNPAFIEALLGGGADVNAEDSISVTPLHLAARYQESPGVVEALLAAGADLEARDGGGNSPLHVAALNNENTAVLEVLLTAGAEVNAKNERDADGTPLTYAVLSNANLAVLQRLVAAGAQAAPGPGGATLLHLYSSLKRSSSAVIEVMLAAGFDANAQDERSNTPLHGAAGATENPAVIEALLMGGADVNAQNDYSHTPLYLAAGATENPAVVEALLAGGSDVNARDDTSRTPLHWAGAYQENVAVIHALLASGAQVNSRDLIGRTPLHLAAVDNENVAVIEALLAAGADVAATDNAGYTAAHRAVEANSSGTVLQVLMDADAKLRNPIFDLSPFRDGNRFFSPLIPSAVNPATWVGLLLRDEETGREEDPSRIYLESQIAGDVSLGGQGKLRFLASNIDKRLDDRKFHSAWQTYFTMLFRLRMLAARSRPVRPVSFMPKLTFQRIGMKRKGQRSASMIVKNLVIGHHSNGQSGCSFVADEGECPRSPSTPGRLVPINVHTGNFSTHYFEASLYYRWTWLNSEGWPYQDYTVGGGSELHMPCMEKTGTMCGELGRRYGKKRFWLSLGATDYQLVGGSGRVEAGVLVGYIPGELVRHRTVMRVELIVYFDRWDVGAYVRGQFGQDHYNINFDNALTRMELGITFNWENVFRVVPKL